MTTFKHEALKELTTQQVRFSPPTRRLEQLTRTERLLVELDPDKQYPYQFICYRITDFRPDAYPDLVITGRDLHHDLGHHRNPGCVYDRGRGQVHRNPQ